MATTTIKEIFEALPTSFNADAAKGVDAIFQYNIEGEGGGNWIVCIKEGTCSVIEGIHESPSVTLNMDASTYTGLVSGEVNSIQAYMSGKLKISGNIMLAQQFPQLFSQ